MIFENLSDRLQGAFHSLKGKGRLSEADVKSAMREVRLALLEADVNYKVVKDFVAKITEQAMTEEIMKSLSPDQQVIKLVDKELTELMGSENVRLEFSSQPPSFIMLAGLQGAGKTTAAAKLALRLRKQGKKPLMVAADVYRPAAIKQLEILGGQIDIPVFKMEGEKDVVKIVKEAYKHAKYYQQDVVIIDTAGRLHVDDDLMKELTRIKNEVEPKEILLVLDAMTGQDAVNVATQFDNELNITGIIMSKLDGDTRGGAALSVKAVTGKSIKFASVGEKISDLEEFHPDRMASKILGMGDVLSLIEKAEAEYDEELAKKMEKKFKENSFDLEDFLQQLEQIQKMGPIGDLLSMIPGVNKKMLEDVNVDDSQITRIKAIIQSMTPYERENPKVLQASRKRRIASGSGTEVSEVNKLLKQFDQSKKMMKKFGKKRGGFPGMGGVNPFK